jgi:hypothetical protein
MRIFAATGGGYEGRAQSRKYWDRQSEDPGSLQKLAPLKLQTQRSRIVATMANDLFISHTSLDDAFITGRTTSSKFGK